MDFPTLPSCPTLKWIPKHLSRRYAAARLRILNWAMEAESSTPRLPALRIEAWSRLALLLPYFILHDTTRPNTPHNTTQPNTPHPLSSNSAAIRRTLTRRLLLAEQCDFLTLMDEARKADHAASLHASNAPVRTRTRGEMLAAASDRAEDGCLRTAARLLMGDSVLPRTEATADAVQALYTHEPQQPLPPPRRGAVTNVSTSTVARRLRNIRGTAHPGPGGERNSHLKALLSSPAGVPTLTRWVNLWLRPEMTPAFRQPWLHCGLVPLDKGGGKPRPIVFQEGLLKLATGCVVDTMSTHLRSAAGPWQRGIYDPGGAVQLVWDLRHAMTTYPDQVFTTIDCRNAFGEVHRSAAIRTASDHCPTFARLLHNLWNGPDTNIHAPDGPGSHRQFRIQDGLVQGGCEAAPAFALALREAIDSFLRQANTDGIPCTIWAYMDDLYLQCHKHHWHQLMQGLTAHLSRVGLTCRPDKSHCHIPNLPPHSAPDHASEFADFATLQPHGLPALGTVADGQFATTLRLDTTHQTEISTRLDKAATLVGCLEELVSTPSPSVRYHPAWRIVDGVVNHCLSYDASITDPGTTVPYGRRLDDLVFTVVTKIIEHPCTDPTTRIQLCLSRDTGGCGLRSAEERCHTAYLAAVTRLAPAQPTLATSQPAITRALAGLRVMGILLDSHAMPHPTHTPPPLAFDPTSPLPTPLPKRQRAWWSLIDSQRADALLALGGSTCKRLSSCGGAEGGAFLRATRADGVRSLTDPFFATAMRYRLGLPVMPACSCQHTTQAKSNTPPRTCTAIADAMGLHATTCKVGGAPYAAHSEGCHIILGAVIQAGYQARREQIIPEFATPACLSPQLDVDGWGLLGQGRLLVDFTLRHPQAARYDTRAPSAAAEAEKSKHYTPTQGLQVQTATLEIFGRHGEGLQRLLEHLADLARVRERQQGLAPTRWLKRWRAQLSNVTARLVGRAVQSACPAN